MERQICEIHTLHLNSSILKRTCSVVVPTCQREVDLAHYDEIGLYPVSLSP